MITKFKEEALRKALRALNLNQQKRFGVFCLDRIVTLYQDIDCHIDISEMDRGLQKGDAFLTFDFIYQNAKQTNDALTLIPLREKCDGLIIDTDEIYSSTTENITYKIVGECLYTFLSFLIEHKVEHILDCSRLMIDLLNAQLSDYLFSILENEEACDQALDKCFQAEYAIQGEAITYISKQDLEGLNHLTDKTMLFKQPDLTLNLLKRQLY
ncbi:hypothetical protein A4G20_06605 [Pasteurellaceae bacterium RH1A]|nr:hypothetical protein A4G20_06605 [Pasteurellaceae bacterium RH1A]